MQVGQHLGIEDFALDEERLEILAKDAHVAHVVAVVLGIGAQDADDGVVTEELEGDATVVGVRCHHLAAEKLDLPRAFPGQDEDLAHLRPPFHRREYGFRAVVC